MPSFTYRAMSAGGETVSGVLTAENYQVALRQLDEQALYPIKVTEGVQGGKSVLGGHRRIKSSHLTIFYGQLSDLLRAGVPMLRSLDVLSKQASNKRLMQAIKELREGVAGGMALGEAMDKHAYAFSPLHASMVKAGEQGGFLEDVLQRIAIFSEKQDELRNKVIGAMIYPCILSTVGTGIVVLLLFFVVPRIREHLRPETFNFMTVIVFTLCDWLQEKYMLLIGVCSVIGMALWTWLKTDGGRRTFEKFKLKAPIIGKITTMVAICRFCRILGTMLHNGVPILQALKISKDSAGSPILADVVEEAADSVKKGAALSTPLGACGWFPPAVVDMIAVAEEGNNLETVLVQIADANEARTARAVDLSVRVLEPLMLLVMASAVFCIMIAILLPILTMGTAG